MLAAHRDQENLVRSHQIQSKQQPKTPGARYPKTPLKLSQNDENAPTIFAGKSGVKNILKPSENDVLTTKGKGAKQALVTPMDTRVRAPLGNKTTNAKARTGQKNGVKDIVKELEKAQIQPTTVQKPRQKPAELAPGKLLIKPDEQESNEEDEPEYAPPNPQPLAYQSDVLPPGGLTTEGLKRENMFKGYYEYFSNPIDDDGVSRQDKEFREEMNLVMKMAEERNARDIDALDWGIEDARDTVQPGRKNEKATTHVPTARVVNRKLPQKHPSTIVSRRAASALSMPPAADKSIRSRPLSAAATTRKPLSSLMRKNPTQRVPLANAPASRNVSAEVASRTTLGYQKGKTASSLVNSRYQSNPTQTSRLAKPVASADATSDLTITPARARQAASKQTPAHESNPTPAFVSIFDPDGDDEDLPPMKTPAFFSDDDEEEFEMKLEL